MVPDLKWLEDPTTFRVNRLDAHSDHIVYQNDEERRTGTAGLRQCLDGEWLFAFSSCPGNRPADFWKEDYDISAFDRIRVPGHLELQGFGKPQYINKLYDWDGRSDIRPPKIDWEDAPVGSYVRFFDLKEELKGKPVCISFQGAETAIFVWLNGQFVGYAEDSFTPSEFELTPYIREEGNRLCVELYKRSSGAWLEDQDFFSFSGLFRSVYLYGRLPVAVEDVWFKTHVSEDLQEGQLQLRLRLRGQLPAAVHFTLQHPKDGVILDRLLPLTEKDGFFWSESLRIPAVRLWDHGTPELYQALLTVENGGLIPYEIGFRRFEIVNKVLSLNGKRLMLNGVNRHEWNPSGGRCITAADMDRAMTCFRENGINAVRTCHYPNRSEWYGMCDREGIYMMDETNLETHGSWQKNMTLDPQWNIPGSLPEWKACVLDRAQSMFERDKNHVSILFWSCGNESYAGEDILAMADYFRAQDPERVVHYEGVYWCREYDRISDVESRMYATPAEIREYLEKDAGKPYISCEYMHSMGNSLGGLESYVRLGEEFPQYQGGFLWDFMDQALWQKNCRGNMRLGYGGDFEDRQSDYNFSANGILTADGEPKPCLQEVRYWFLEPEKRAAFDRENARLAAEAKLPEAPACGAPLRIVNGDGAFGVRGEQFEILFSKLQGGPVSLVSGGREWLWRAPRPAFWRAPTENDCGCGFHERSAIWSAVDAWQKCVDFDVEEKSEDAFSITYSYSADCMPELLVQVNYRVERSGCMTVRCSYPGKTGRPELPLFGLRFQTAQPVEETRWLGLSGETYPDRWKGARYGQHGEVPHISDYLVPQECGSHFRTDSMTLSCGGRELTVVKGDKPFSFSALPCTPAQLAEAFHRDELPDIGRTVVTICGEMRGVGGIDTWMSDVEAPWRVSAGEDHEFSFKLYL